MKRCKEERIADEPTGQKWAVGAGVGEVAQTAGTFYNSLDHWFVVCSAAQLFVEVLMSGWCG